MVEAFSQEMGGLNFGKIFVIVIREIKCRHNKYNKSISCRNYEGFVVMVLYEIFGNFFDIFVSDSMGVELGLIGVYPVFGIYVYHFR